MALSVDQQALKQASAKLVKAVGGQEAAESLCRVGQSTLSDGCSFNKENAYLAVDVVADLEAVSVGLPGAPHVTRELARRSGHSLVPLPPAKPHGMSWLDHIASLSKEAGEITSKLAVSCGDGVCAKDIKQHDLLREADELIQAAVNLRAALQTVAEGE